MHIISKIIDAKPYKIVVEFDKNDVREIDFLTLVEAFPLLKDEKVFASVSLDDYPTIKWDGLAKMHDYNGELISAPLDFCPDTLYRMSKPI
jgi:hypothetical protein